MRSDGEADDRETGGAALGGLTVVPPQARCLGGGKAVAADAHWLRPYAAGSLRFRLARPFVHPCDIFATAKKDFAIPSGSYLSVI